MFIPKYTITNKILKDISLIEVGREVISENSLNHTIETRLKNEELSRAVYEGVAIEGNPSTEEEVKEILMGKQINEDPKDIQEVINYYQAFLYIFEAVEQIKNGQRTKEITLDEVLSLHKLITRGIMLPELSGEFRTKQVAIRNSLTGEIAFTPPPAAEVPYLTEDLINFINDPESEEIHPILKAALFHAEALRIHPFLDGNGKLVRILTTFLLSVEGYDFKKFVYLESYFNNQPYVYYQILQNIFNQKVLDNHERDSTKFLEYFSEGLLLEVNKIKEIVKSVAGKSKVKDEAGEEHQLNEREMLIIDYLHRYGSMQNKDFRKIFPEHSDDTVLREIKFLKQKGLVKKVGGTKKARYVLA